MNKVILIGNLARDPDVRTTGSGTAVTTFSIAVDRKYKAQDGSQLTDFFDIVTWRKLAEICGRYLTKGSKVAVVGELQNRSYSTKDGTKRYVTEVVAESVEFLIPKQATPDVSSFEEVDEDLPFD